jgi:undecaprenyl-diphosphatase
MVLIPVLGQAFLDLMKGGFSPQASGIPAWSLLIGFVAAYLSGLAACNWMIALVRKAKLWGFVGYCCLAGAFCLLLSFIK